MSAYNLYRVWADRLLGKHIGLTPSAMPQPGPPPMPDMDFETPAILRKQERVMAATRKLLFTVYEVGNGYVAEIAVDAGSASMVIGKTLSEVCDAAQAEAASQKVQADIPDKRISDLLSVWDDEDAKSEQG